MPANPIRTLAIAIVSSLAALAAAPQRADAHEFWIEPSAYQIPAADAIDVGLSVRLRNGEMFVGQEYYYNPQHFLAFERWVGGAGGATDGAVVDGRLGDRPAATFDDATAGLMILAYQSRYDRVDYEDWASFEDFATHKGHGDVAERHAERGLEQGPLRETYMRFAKTLIAVGPEAADGADAALGFEFELVALDNPYAGAIDALRVLAIYQGEPWAERQIELFARGPDGVVEMTTHRTDADGVAVLPIAPGHDYLVNTVALRAPSPAVAEHTGGVWETLWATLTFAVPAE